MPIPRGVARVNKRITNKITSPFARRLGSFGVVHHVGRSTGEHYRTPINCWKKGGVVTVALTYGPEVDWLKNLEAAGGGVIEIRADMISIGPPKALSTEEGLTRMSAFVRYALNTLDVTEFREFEVLSSSCSSSIQPRS